MVRALDYLMNWKKNTWEEYKHYRRTDHYWVSNRYDSLVHFIVRELSGFTISFLVHRIALNPKPTLPCLQCELENNGQKVTKDINWYVIF